MAYILPACYGHSISSPVTDFTYKYLTGRRAVELQSNRRTVTAA